MHNNFKIMLIFLIIMTNNYADTTKVNTNMILQDTLVIKTITDNQSSDNTFLHTIIGVSIGAVFALLGTFYTIRNQNRQQNKQLLVTSKQNWLNQIKEQFAEYNESVHTILAMVYETSINEDKYEDNKNIIMLFMNTITKMNLIMTNLRTAEIVVYLTTINTHLTMLQTATLLKRKSILDNKLHDRDIEIGLEVFLEDLKLSTDKMEEVRATVKEEYKKMLNINPDKMFADSQNIINTARSEIYRLLPVLDQKMYSLFIETNKEIDKLLEAEPSIFNKIKSFIEKIDSELD